MDQQSSTLSPTQHLSPNQMKGILSSNENQGCSLTPSREDTAPFPTESICGELSGDSNASLQNDNSSAAPDCQDSSSCPSEASTSGTDTPNQLLDHSSSTMETKDYSVRLNRHDTLPSAVVSLPNQDEVPGLMTPTISSSHTRTALPVTDTSSVDSSDSQPKSGQTVKKGLKRKTPSASISMETSIHLPDSSSTFHDPIAAQNSKETPLSMLNENDGDKCTAMKSKNFASISSSQATPEGPEELDQIYTPKLTEVSLPSQLNVSHNESQGVEHESCPISPSREDSEHNDDSKLGLENESCSIDPVSQDPTPCLAEVSSSIPNQLPDHSSITVESEDCTIRSNGQDITPYPVEPLPTHDGVSLPVIKASPSHPSAALPDTDGPTDASNLGISSCHSKSEKKIKKCMKRKTQSANKGIQTSIHLIDSNSAFRDRIVDIGTLRKETGVVNVEDLQDLDVSLDEWPILLVNQLRLRDTIVNNLNSVICELVECGQVLEQDLDYLKLKNLELQQEIKKRTKEDQQSNKNHRNEVESQTTEEDLAEAWNRWYYGCWGDYYSESDPNSSMYWPGHYMQPSTVHSTDSKDEETQQKLAKQSQAGDEDIGELHEGPKSEKDNVKKSKEKECSNVKSEMKASEKRKKLKGKRKEKHKRHKSEKSYKEHAGVEKGGKLSRDAGDKNEKRKKEEKRKRKEKKRNGSSQMSDSAVNTQESQEEISSTASTTELTGAKEEEDKSLGWDTSQSITEQVATVAAQAVMESGYVFQEESGLYYDYNTGYYYNAENGLYYDTKSGTYFYYDHTTQSYQFHSQVSPTTTNDNSSRNSSSKRHKRKTPKKEATISSNKNENAEDKEDGECSDSEGEGQDAEGESEDEKEEGDATSPSHHDEVGEGDIPPSLRLMVVEGGEKVRVGELHVVTMNGGTVGKEATNDVCLPDLNVSKVHAEIEYRSTGADDHHYFLRDLGSRNGTFVNSVRLSEARQPSKQVEVGHGWEVQFGTIKVKFHLHPGNLTCNECEPGLVLHSLPSSTLKPESINSFKNAKCKERARRKELKAMQKKYKLTHRDPQAPTAPAAGYTDRTLLRQSEKGSDNPYEKTEVASTELPLKETNRGFVLLQKMGWSKGHGLGKSNTGITEPVQPVSVVGQAGLGSSHSSALPSPDPRSDRRRNQIQITKERYKQATLSAVHQEGSSQPTRHHTALQ